MVHGLTCTLTWVDLHANPDALDNIDITNPDTEIVDAANRIFQTGGQANRLRLRLKYDEDMVTVTTDVVVSVWGRYTGPDGNSDQWQQLVDLQGAVAHTLTIDIDNDVTDATWKWTAPHPTTHSFVLEGCNEILVGTQVVLAASSGTVTNAIIEGKFI